MSVSPSQSGSVHSVVHSALQQQITAAWCGLNNQCGSNKQHRQINGPAMFGQSPYGNIVHAGFCNFNEIPVTLYVTGCFQFNGFDWLR